MCSCMCALVLLGKDRRHLNQLEEELLTLRVRLRKLISEKGRHQKGTHNFEKPLK